MCGHFVDFGLRQVKKISGFLTHQNFLLLKHEFLQKRKKLFIGSILDNNLHN